jgi:hypothetical protein
MVSSRRPGAENSAAPLIGKRSLALSQQILPGSAQLPAIASNSTLEGDVDDA